MSGATDLLKFSSMVSIVEIYDPLQGKAENIHG
jgi:hypothetical protein